MSESSEPFKPGLEGVVAFETEIAEPDRQGGALRYRGVNIEDLIGKVSFGNVWALLVDGKFGPGLPPAEPFPVPVHSGDIRVDVQSAVAMLAPYWGLSQLLDSVSPGWSSQDRQGTCSPTCRCHSRQLGGASPSSSGPCCGANRSWLPAGDL